MRRSEFERAVSDEFGARAGHLLRDLALPEFGGRSADEALNDGEPPREIWLSLCAQMDVPMSRRHGVGRMEPRR